MICVSISLLDTLRPLSKVGLALWATTLLLAGTGERAFAQKIRPEENRFTKTVLSNDLNEPMELAVAPDGRVFFTERKGNFYVYDPKTKATRLVRAFPVYWETKYGNGLIGLALDPKFEQNHFVYFYYTPISDTPKQYVSRFILNDDNTLDLASEKVIIEIPIDYEISRHTGGSLAFNTRTGDLFISTGDNTSPFASKGYTPIDERPERSLFDDQRSAGNTNDLRGKILRIRPQLDGSYTIPQGNLFPTGTAGTRPEIYAMGCRNPYRIAVDAPTGALYWGEIGPDAGQDGPQGPRGYDEFNQALQAGNFGWPYFIGNNIAYRDFNFGTEAIGAPFDPQKPINDSPNNTGLRELPPAQSALIWYPYDSSSVFPELGRGGRSAIAGPVYRQEEVRPGASGAFPAYYEGVFFITEWMRNWVLAVHLDERLAVKRIEPFMPQSGDFRRPIDMTFGPDGTLYMLEYGSVYGIDNEDARLVQITYNAGNRVPIAKAKASVLTGTAPLSVSFDASLSRDLDDDALTYSWEFGKGAKATGKETSFTFTKNGRYPVVLRVTDTEGQSHTDTLLVRVGNTPPSVALTTAQNRTFYTENRTLSYRVQVSDKEDKNIDPKRIVTQLNYLPSQASVEQIGHQEFTEDYNYGRALLEKSDCKACHQLDKPSVGPQFIQIAAKYRGDKAALAALANKVIVGGGGVWGEVAMNAHPQLSKEEATEIVKYVLALGDASARKQLPPTGQVALSIPPDEKPGGYFLLTATYADKGGAINDPLSGKASLLLRSPDWDAYKADSLVGWRRTRSNALQATQPTGLLVFKEVDMSGVRSLAVEYSLTKTARMEVRSGSQNGPLLGSVGLQPSLDRTSQRTEVSIEPTKGAQTLYLLVTRPDEETAVELRKVFFALDEGGNK